MSRVTWHAERTANPWENARAEANRQADALLWPAMLLMLLLLILCGWLLVAHGMVIAGLATTQLGAP